MHRTLLLTLVALAGCGYHFAGEKVGLPDDIHSLAVGTIVNRSREYGLEKTLAFTMEREIHERGHFRMAERPADGDAVLTGTIRDVRLQPVAFDANDLAVKYEIKIVVDFILTRQSDGHVLWRASALEETDEYSANTRVVVTSSPQFQRGTLDAADLQNSQLTQIQLAETERANAITRAINQAARDAYNQMVENF